MGKLVLMILFPALMLSQWKTESGVNDFDGPYKVAYVSGKGGDYPNKPILSVVKFEDSSPSLRISGIGYVGCERNTLRLLFNDDDDIILCDRPTANSDKDFLSVAFFENIAQADFFIMMKQKSKISIRHVSPTL